MIETQSAAQGIKDMFDLITLREVYKHKRVSGDEICRRQKEALKRWREDRGSKAETAQIANAMQRMRDIKAVKSIGAGLYVEGETFKETIINIIQELEIKRYITVWQEEDNIIVASNPDHEDSVYFYHYQIEEMLNGLEITIDDINL